MTLARAGASKREIEAWLRAEGASRRAARHAIALGWERWRWLPAPLFRRCLRLLALRSAKSHGDR